MSWYDQFVIVRVSVRMQQAMSPPILAQRSPAAQYWYSHAAYGVEVVPQVVSVLNEHCHIAQES